MSLQKQNVSPNPTPPLLLKSKGDDVFISKNVEIRRPHLVSIGSHVAIDSGFYLTTSAEISDYIHIAAYVTIIGGEKSKLIMQPFSTIAAGARIICGSDEVMGEGLNGMTPIKYRDNIVYTTITMEKFTAVGTNVIIMPGVTLREGCVIAPGSLVTSSTEPWTVYAGSPARPIKKRPKEKMIAYAKELGYS